MSLRVQSNHLLPDERVTPGFGIDFGGVIVKTRKQILGEDTSLEDLDNAEIARAGVFEAIREIVSFFDGRVWIVYKAGSRMQERTRLWLDRERFFSRTALDPAHIRFCRERQEKEKICQELGITHFVDDRVHLMQILRSTVPNLYLFGEPGDERFCPPWAIFVSTWSDLLSLVTGPVHSKYSSSNL